MNFYLGIVGYSQSWKFCGKNTLCIVMSLITNMMDKVLLRSQRFIHE